MATNISSQSNNINIYMEGRRDVSWLIGYNIVPPKKPQRLLFTIPISEFAKGKKKDSAPKSVNLLIKDYRSDKELCRDRIQLNSMGYQEIGKVKK